MHSRSATSILVIYSELDLYFNLLVGLFVNQTLV